MCPTRIREFKMTSDRKSGKNSELDIEREVNVAVEQNPSKKNEIGYQSKDRYFICVIHSLNKNLVLIALFLLLPFVCMSQKSKSKNKIEDKISYFTKPSIETNILKTVYAYKNNTSVGYIKYKEQLTSVENIKRYTYRTFTTEEYKYQVPEKRYNSKGDPVVGVDYKTVTSYRNVPVYKYSDEVLSRKTDTTYIKECGCNVDYTKEQFKVSKLYPDWSTMSEEQIKEWLIKNCNQETIDKLYNDFIDKK